MFVWKKINLLIVLLVIFSISIETYMYITGQVNNPDLPSDILGRLIYYYSYFTVLSNILAALGAAILFFKPNIADRWFRILYLDAAVCIIITFLVYNFVLRRHDSRDGILVYTNNISHVIVPFLTVWSWCLYNVTLRIDKKIFIKAVLPPIIYVFFIFIRGKLIGIYPYFFLNVNKIGFLKSIINVIIITIIFFFLEFILFIVDRKIFPNKLKNDILENSGSN